MSQKPEVKIIQLIKKTLQQPTNKKKHQLRLYILYTELATAYSL